jgi:hypothetical protein
LNKKIDFSSYGISAVRESELYLPSIPLAGNLYSDTGYRFRRNYFDRNDNWLLQDN